MFYARFYQLCKDKGVSRTKACVDCGVSRTAWHKWENNAIPNGATINALASYFGVSVGYLLTGETDEKTPAATTGNGLTDAQRELMSLIPTMTPGEVSVLLATAKAQAAARTGRDNL